MRASSACISAIFATVTSSAACAGSFGRTSRLQGWKSRACSMMSFTVAPA